jgi:4-carboxymuconolactone decarboxylase
MAISRRNLIKAGVSGACALAAGGASALQSTMPQSSAQGAPAAPTRQTQMPKPGPVTDRMPEIPAEKMTAEQKKAAEEFAAGRGTPVFGPFVPLLRSPEVMLRAKAMGDYLRYKSSLPAQINEWAILITARAWSQQYEWAVHYPIALKSAVRPELAADLAEGRRPIGMAPEEEIIYDFCTELHQNKSVSDTTYNRVLGKYGEKGIIDLVGVSGYYTFLAMVLNTTRTALPKEMNESLPLFPR